MFGIIEVCSARLSEARYAHSRPYQQDGIFYISSFTKTETTFDAIDLALKTYERLWQQGIDQQTLDSAKAYLKGQFPPRYETAEQLAGLLGQMFVYDFDASYINNFEQQVNSLDLQTTRALIKKHFPRENLQFVLIGKSEEIRDQAKKYGDVRELEITDPGFAQSSP